MNNYRIVTMVQFELFHFSYVSTENNHFDAIWDAAQAFNDDYKVKSWIIHHDVRKQNNYSVSFSMFS